MHWWGTHFYLLERRVPLQKLHGNPTNQHLQYQRFHQSVKSWWEKLDQRVSSDSSQPYCMELMAHSPGDIYFIENISDHRKQLILTWTQFLQAVVYKLYPALLSLNVLICFFASLQSSFLALFFARNPALWKLEWNVQLLTIIYCVIHTPNISVFMLLKSNNKHGMAIKIDHLPLVYS